MRLKVMLAFIFVSAFLFVSCSSSSSEARPDESSTTSLTPTTSSSTTIPPTTSTSTTLSPSDLAAEQECLKAAGSNVWQKMKCSENPNYVPNSAMPDGLRSNATFGEIFDAYKNLGRSDAFSSCVAAYVTTNRQLGSIPNFTAAVQYCGGVFGN